MKKEIAIQKLNPLFFGGIAHRGYHNSETTENGLDAFSNALAHKLAIELDVHLTADNKLIVCHDSDLFRTTGSHGIIENLTFQDIRENYRLFDNGFVPTLREVLNLVDEQVPIVIELKAYQRNHKALAAALLNELKVIKDKKNIMLISFDPRALLACKKSGFIRALLVCEKVKWTYIFRHLFEAVDLEYTMLQHKKIKRYYKKHLVNCWTIRSEKELTEIFHYTDLVTLELMDYETVHRKLKVIVNLSTEALDL